MMAAPPRAIEKLSRLETPKLRARVPPTRLMMICENIAEDYVQKINTDRKVCNPEDVRSWCECLSLKRFT